MDETAPIYVGIAVLVLIVVFAVLITYRTDRESAVRLAAQRATAAERTVVVGPFVSHASVYSYIRPAKLPTPSRIITNLPCVRYDASKGASKDEQCVICFCEYEQDDNLKLLPCLHTYHAECIDAWLKRDRVCPICQADVVLAVSLTQREWSEHTLQSINSTSGASSPRAPRTPAASSSRETLNASDTHMPAAANTNNTAAAAAAGASAGAGDATAGSAAGAAAAYAAQPAQLAPSAATSAEGGSQEAAAPQHLPAAAAAEQISVTVLPASPVPTAAVAPASVLSSNASSVAEDGTHEGSSSDCIVYLGNVLHSAAQPDAASSHSTGQGGAAQQQLEQQRRKRSISSGAEIQPCSDVPCSGRAAVRPAGLGDSCIVPWSAVCPRLGREYAVAVAAPSVE